MNSKTMLLAALASFLFLASSPTFAQNVEITGYVGGQVNGGLDLSTTIFERLEVENAMNYGASIGYLYGEHYGFEFSWNHSRADTVGEPIGGGPNVRLGSLNQNQYMGNFVFHVTEREVPLRPFVFVGVGASALSPSRPGVEGTTRFAFAIGGGAKYNVHKHFGLRGQFRYSPTYLTTTTEGFWCDPFWGGCWTVGDQHYLHAFDVSGGITFRF
jgi:opacity protein-like surface antigen